MSDKQGKYLPPNLEGTLVDLFTLKARLVQADWQIMEKHWWKEGTCDKKLPPKEI